MFGIIEKVKRNGKVLYGIIDSSDNVVEYYDKNQLFNIVRNSNLDIIGISENKSCILPMYEITWRFDFDKTLDSVLTINDDSFDLRDKSVVNMLKSEFSYLTDLNHFQDWVLRDWSSNFKSFKKLDAKYIDYVNIGYNRGDGRYDFVQYWRTDLKEIRFDYADKGCPLSRLGKFQFDDCGLPCRTRTLENGRVIWDFRRDSEYNKLLINRG